MKDLRCRLGFHSTPLFDPDKQKQEYTQEEFTLLIKCRRCGKPFDFSKAREMTPEEERQLYELLHKREGTMTTGFHLRRLFIEMYTSTRADGRHDTARFWAVTIPRRFNTSRWGAYNIFVIRHPKLNRLFPIVGDGGA